MNSIVNALRNHRQAVKRQQDHAASLVRDDVPARTFEVEVVEQMIADNADSFYEEPIHKAMERACKCGHDRYRHWDATDSCDLCRDCHSFEEAANA